MKPLTLHPHEVRHCLVSDKVLIVRVVKPALGPEAYWVEWEGIGWKTSGLIGDIPDGWSGRLLESPFGPVGTQHWVRETWQMFFKRTQKSNGCIYLADAGTGRINADTEVVAKVNWPGWKSPQTMPQWASRLTLRTTSITVKRVQDVTEDESRNVGIRVLPLQDPADQSSWYESSPGQHQARTAIQSFAKLWSQHNRRHPWETSPWVWLATMETVKS